MKPILYLFLLLPMLASAQDEKCVCCDFRQRGQKDFDAGRYDDAIKKWTLGQKAPDIDKCPDLADLINKAKRVKTEREEEDRLWNIVGDSQDPKTIQRYLKEYPNGRYATEAQNRIKNISDRDKDGVPDKEDECPDEKGKASMNGCPDSDGDGVSDKYDRCRDVKGPVDNKGCPRDSDGDGIVDDKDDCPKEAGPINGCPDADGDDLADKDDDCPQVKGRKDRRGCPDNDDDGFVDVSAKNLHSSIYQVDECPSEAGTAMGCPDKDEDGVADKKDNCPDLKGSLQNNGCPVDDSDGDGVKDEDDRCPDKPGTAHGCPDQDKDGVTDNNDDCPYEAGPASNSGCPKAVDFAPYMSFEGETPLYEWIRIPYSTYLEDHSVGSILGLKAVPRLNFTSEKSEVQLSLDAAVGISPWGFNFDGYRGMGFLTFPIVAEVGLKNDDETGPFVGLGYQFTWTDLYFHSKKRDSYSVWSNRFLVRVGWLIEDDTRLIGHLGWGQDDSFSFSFGIGSEF